MENIILTNNKDLRLVGVKVGVLSTLRFELPLVSASATHVEVIVTSGNVHSAYTATFIDATKRWQCDIAASQFPAVGRQSYEIAYVLDGKQFWDGKGWIDIADATTSGIEPQPRPEPYRYAVVSVNGYGADAQGAARIPKTFITTDSPETTEGYIEGDICFNRETGATWTLCNVQGTLTWVFNYKNYYTKAETEEAIERVAAYYITADAQGNPFATHAALVNAQAYYSGGAVRTPTRNDYAVVSADETHGGAEWRYIYAVDAQGAGQWEPQYAVEGVIAYDNTVTRTSANGVKSSGIWSAIWGVLAALPTGFSSLYDWCVAQLAGKVPTSRTVNGKALTDDVTLTADDIDYSVPGGAQSVQMTLDGVNTALNGKQDALTTTQLANIAAVSDALAFDATHSYAAGDPVVYNGTLYTFTATHTGAWTGSDVSAVDIIARLALKANDNAVVHLTGEQQTMSAVLQLLSTLYAESGVESHGDYRLTWTVEGNYAGTLTISQDTISVQLAGESEPRWYKLQAGGGGTVALLENIAPAFVYLQPYDVDDLCTSFDADPSHMGTWLYKCIAATDGSTYPETDTTHWTPATVEDVIAALRTGKLDSTSAAPAFSSDSSTQYAVGSHVTYNGKLYKCTTATTGGTWDASKWTADTMTDPDAVLDVTSQNQLRVVAKDGTLLWAQGYDLASASSATLACDAVNNFTFADGATTQAFALPTAPSGKVGDFGLDIDNSANTGAATLTLTGLDTAFSVVVPEDESLTDMLAIAAGELARFYVTLTTFRVNNLPTWHIVKQVVENGGAQS